MADLLAEDLADFPADVLVETPADSLEGAFFETSVDSLEVAFEVALETFARDALLAVSGDAFALALDDTLAALFFASFRAGPFFLAGVAFSGVTSSMIEIIAPSPRRGPSLMTRLYPPFTFW